MKKINYTKNKRGFTLIELMVATAIFVTAMLTSMSSLFFMLDAAKNAKALRFAMDNVNFAMESMSRSIRMGTNYYCGSYGEYIDTTDLTSVKDCSNIDTSGGTLIAFQSQDPLALNKIVYKLSGPTSKGTFYVSRCGEGNVCVPIISPEINIERLKFFVEGSTGGDNKQARVYIIMKGTVIVKGVPTSFSIQTMASKRNFY